MINAAADQGSSRSLLVAVVYALLITGALAGQVARGADATDEKHSLWVMESDTNRTYLLGSIHVLRERDYPLPQVIYDAYEDAEQLVMEIDLSRLDPLHALALSRQVAMLPEADTLATVVGAENFARALLLAKKNQINLQMFERVEPWFAAMTISQMQMQRLGFSADKGIELHFLKLALQDEKPQAGLETIEQQLGILDQLPMDEQIRFFLDSLTETQTLLEEGEHMLRAWKTGDSAKLEAMFADELKSSPQLRQALLVDRNQRWLPKIAALSLKQR